jgi:membrane-associated phospholipid phosphatase
VIRALLREINEDRFREYLLGFSHYFWASFRGAIRFPYILLHFLAILITIPLVLFEIDWTYFVFFRNNEFFQIILFLAVPLGSLIPLFLPPIIYLYGKIEQKSFYSQYAFGLTQTAVLGLFWSSLYKAFTGRMGPEFDKYDSSLSDYSKDWAFGILQRGVFDGWPSGHTTIAIAFCVVFYYYKPVTTNPSLIKQWEKSPFRSYRKYILIYAFFVPFGISTNIHWLSDVIAGILIGLTIGQSVLKTYPANYVSFNTSEVDYKHVYLILTLILITIIFSFFGFQDI